MQLLKQLFNFYINSNVHVALSALSLTWITLLEFKMLRDSDVLFFVFFASITGYNFVKFFEISRFYRRNLPSWIKLVQIVFLFSFIFSLYFVLQLREIAQVYIIGFGLITFFYTVPISFTYLKINKNLRNVGGLKIYLIAVVWVGATLLLPLLNSNHILDTDVLMAGVQRLLFIIALILPFEIRDLKYDSFKLATIPQKIGVKSTKTIGVVLLFLFFILEFLKDDSSSKKIFITGFICFITSCFILFSKQEQSKYYASFWVEGLPIVWLLIWFLIH